MSTPRGTPIPPDSEDPETFGLWIQTQNIDFDDLTPMEFATVNARVLIRAYVRSGLSPDFAYADEIAFEAVYAYAKAASRVQKPKPWIKATMHHMLAKAVRDLGGEAFPVPVSDDSAACEFFDSTVVDDNEDAPDPQLEEMRQMIDRLSPKLRQVVEMRLLGMSHLEIAKELDIKHGTVRVRYSRALARLREILSESPARRVS